MPNDFCDNFFDILFIFSEFISIFFKKTNKTVDIIKIKGDEYHKKEIVNILFICKKYCIKDDIKKATTNMKVNLFKFIFIFILYI